MSILALYKAVILLSVPVVVFSQSDPQVDRRSFMSLPASFAYELGKTYQMGKNCKKELHNITSSKAEGLFFRYMEENEVQHTMLNYKRGVESKIGMAYERKELKAFIPVLHARIGNYFKIAGPFTRPHVDR